jgi:protocatechuate 3,4-dioxygenase alpha subunit
VSDIDPHLDPNLEQGGQTPSQTVGPYFTMRLSGEGENVLTTPETLGQRIRIEGRVFDGDRKHIEDALIELWQADSAGRYHHPADNRDDIAPDPAFIGFGRCASDFQTGAYSFLTVKPGPVPYPHGGMQAPHISITVQARGMLNPTFTRVYFADEAAANAADPVLQSVPEARRSTLIAERIPDTDSPVPTFQFDIRYQGDDETVFFDV